MAPEMSPALQLALARAQRIAGGVIEPEHLLRGLLAELEGLPVRLLALDVEPWTSRYPQDQHLDIPEPGEETLRLAPAVTLILQQATHQPARYSEEGSLSTDQVLFALLELNESARSHLEAFGFDYPRFRQEHLTPAAPLPLEEPLQFQEGPEAAVVYRTIDACANRAREGLRVLEDYCRFALDDALLSSELKGLRHGLTEALQTLPPHPLLQARDTLHDVGTAISTPRESTRESLGDIVQANLKRLQEALRSLEEFGKFLDPEFGQGMERLRYRTYTLEKALVLGGRARERLRDAKLYVLVTEKLCKHSLLGTVREAIEGGTNVIQLREKDMDDQRLLATAREIRRTTRERGVLFIVNDRPDIAFLAEADGVHLGQEDLPIAEARKIVGPDALVGQSTHDMEQVRRALLEGADYIGVGPTFPSQTKSFDAFAGLAFVREAASQTSLPAFVLGGVNLDNLDRVLAEGAQRVAVSHAVCGSDDPRKTSADFLKKLNRAPNEVVGTLRVP